MPSWKYHRRRGKDIPLPRSVKIAIDRELDFPVGRGHKALHNPLGIAYIGAKYGPLGAEYARRHIVDDYLEETKKRLLRDLLKDLDE